MNSEFKLYIFPDNPEFQDDDRILLSLIKKLELAGNQLSKNQYQVGNNFLSLITFMGCSPDIEIEPNKDKPFCYIELGSSTEAVFKSGKNTKYPKCPSCNKKLTSQTCSNCDEKLNVKNINWRKTAFFAKCWVCIGNIYELEAIPNDNLLSALGKKTGTKWKTAYIRESFDE